MTQWMQNYTAVGGSLALTAIAAVIPILFLFWALAIKRMKGHFAALGTLAITILVAIFAYKMPVLLTISATLYGALYGVWNVAWIVITAVFLYNLTVEAGQFEIIKNSIASLTDDRRIQSLLIAFCFGAFLEGAAGFGTPIAISGAILIGLGFSPLYAAGLCMIANTGPVAFGALGIPVITSAQVTGLSDMALSKVVGGQLSLISLIIPLYLVVLLSGWKGAKEVLPAILVTGISYASLQWYTATYLGPMLPNIISSLGSMLILTIFLKVWQPKNIYRFSHDKEISGKTQLDYSTGQIIRAWSPFVVLTAVVAVWGIPAFKNWLIHSHLYLSFTWPGLYAAGKPIIYKVAPIVTKPEAYAALFKWDYLASPGTAIFLSTIISSFILGISVSRFFATFAKTLKQLTFPLTTIVSVLGFAFLANYSGLSYTLGMVFASTGKLFPFLSPFLGWLAVFLTGSDTSANALFSKLQQVTGQQIGVNPVLTVAANSSGGVTGKMVSPQSIAVASASVGLTGRESELFRFTVKHSFVFLLIVGIMTYVQAYIIPWTVPISH